MARMNLVSKLYQSSVLKRLSELDWMNGSNSPYVVELDPTSACDLACPGCISGKLLNKQKFSNERLLKMTEELVVAGVKAVILIGGGEPLTHPAIGKSMEYLGENDVQIGITTNGTQIDKYIEPIVKHATWTRVSVDAATEETFLHLRPTRRGTSRFAHIIRNMEMLAKRKTGILGYSYLIRTASDGSNESIAGLDKFGTISNSNVSEIYAAAKLAKEIGCDYFEPKPSYDDNHYLVAHEAHEMEHALEQIEKAKELEDDNFRILESVNLRHSLKLEQMSSQPKDYNKCPSAELRTLITSSGVYVCPYFRGREDKKIGDLRTETLSEMWKSDRRKEVMEKLDPSKDCGMHCIRHDTNLALNKIHDDMTQSVEVKSVDSETEDRFI